MSDALSGLCTIPITVAFLLCALPSGSAKEPLEALHFLFAVRSKNLLSEDLAIIEEKADLHDVYAYSLANDNEEFLFRFVFDSRDAAERFRGVRINGKEEKVDSVEVGSIYSDDGSTRWHAAELKLRGRQTAEAMARALQTELHVRSPSNEKILVTFSGTNPGKKRSKDVFVDVVVRNIGSEAATFEHVKEFESRQFKSPFLLFQPVIGGMNYQLATHNEAISPGGVGGYKVVLEPNKDFRFSIDISKWLTFRKPGRYKVLGILQLPIVDASYSAKAPAIRWISYMGDEFDVSVK